MINKPKTVVPLIVVFVLSLLSTSIAHAQEEISKDKKGDFRGYFMVGGNILDIEAFNTRLESEGYSEFSDNLISFGGGCSYSKHNSIIIMGAEGHILITEEKEASIPSGDYKTSLSCLYGSFNFGVLVYSKRGLNVYPFLGIGYGEIGLKIGPYVFDDILEYPTRGAELSTGGFLLNLGAGTDYLVRLWGDDKTEKGFVFGLRLGYTFTPFKETWQMDEIDISGGPETGITGPYLRITMGFGARTKD